MRRLRQAGRERGALSVELVGVVPILVLITLVVVQGMLAVTTVSAVQQAARDGARAQMTGQRSVDQAVHDQVPDWITVERIDTGAAAVADCAGHCVSVEARIPIGIPSFSVDTVTVRRTADFPG
ncbi:pilus assembly protein [Georgenia yuyongxinii]|uniref:Pilus assembly protein n=1 Tax=Georgenia yuyongxinii TaxID=2589797 RepID=A0A5B8C650_9MICO|nr:TadE family protein [Georgenia yuyongxinii]QDC25914.1 pilus assembly protein [Georgenia yuyongxinii]